MKKLTIICLTEMINESRVVRLNDYSQRGLAEELYNKGVRIII